MAESLGEIRGQVKLETKGFEQGISQINRQLRLVKSEMDTSSAKMRAFGQSQDQLRLHANLLAKQIDLQKQKVSLLSQIHEAYNQKLGANATETEKMAVRLNRAQAELANMEGALRRVNTQMDQQRSLFGRFGQNMFHIREQAIETGIALGAMSGGLAVALGSAVKKAADFEAQLSSVKAVTGASNAEMEQFRQLAIQMGANTKFSALEALQAIEELAKAGVSTSDILNGGLKGALDLAAAGELNLAEAAEIASTALNAFKADHLSVAQAANILAGAANASATDVQELRYGLAASAAVASGAGLSFRDTATALAVFAQNGLKGSDAGTSLKTMLLNLTPSSKQAAEEMKKLGIITENGKNQFFDAHGKVKSFAEIAEVLQDRLKNLSEEQRNQALKTMFGTDAIRAANIAFKEGAEGVRQMAQEMSKTTAAEVARQRMDNLKGTMEQLRGAFETAQIEMGTMFLPVLRSLANGVQNVVDWFSQLSPTTKEAIGIFASVTSGVLALGGAIAGIIAISNPFVAAIVGAGVAIGGFAGLSHKLSADMKQAETDARRFGVGVSQGTIQAAKGYMDLRDKAMVNLARLRIASGTEAKKIVQETVTIFAQMGDKIVAELKRDKINVQKATATMLAQVPNALKPAVQKVADDAIKKIDAQIKKIQQANQIVRKGLLEYGGNLAKMPQKFAAEYQKALQDLDKRSQTFVKKISDLNSFMKKFESERGKISVEGAKQWMSTIEKTYQHAVNAAKQTSKELKAIWEEQLANGNITREQYNQQIAIINQMEQEKIAAAQQKRAQAIQELRKSMSEEAQQYQLATGQMLDGYMGYVTAKAGLMKSDAQLNEEGKKSNEEFANSVSQSADKATAAAQKGRERLIKLYGDMGIVAMESFTKGLRSQSPEIIAQKLGLDLKSKMKIDLGPDGKVTAESFVKGLANGTYGFNQVAAYFNNRLKQGMKVDLSPEGKQNIATLRAGMQAGIVDVNKAASLLGLDIKSKMKVNLGPQGQYTVQTLLKGLQDGKVDIQTFAKGIEKLLKTNAKANLHPEGKAAGDSHAKGLKASQPNVQASAMALRLGVQSLLGKTTDGGGGNKAGSQFASGILSNKGKAAGNASSVANAAKGNLHVDAYGLGGNVSSSFASGILGGKFGVISAAASIARAAWNTIKSTLGIASPSKEMIKLGKFTTEGFEQGMKSRLYQVQKLSKLIAETAMLSVKQSPISNAGGNTIQTASSNVTVPVYVSLKFDQPVFFNDPSSMQKLADGLAPLIANAINKQDILLDRAKGVISFG
jgi:TP901 family phage tail tape measure protein